MERIKKLLERYINDTASGSERNELFNLIQRGKLDDELLENMMKEIFDEEPSSDMRAESVEKIRSYILSQEGPGRVIPIRKKRNWTIAAAVTLIVLVMGAWWTLSTNTAPDQAASYPTEKDKLFSFTDLQNKYIRLPDGSTVILNKESELSYRKSYGESKREVTLNGEAFFDVIPDPLKPFIVRSGEISTKVLGTAFNVKAYPGEDEITVTVTKGKVQVNSIDQEIDVITPDEQIVVNTATHQFAKVQLNADSTLLWKNDYLILDHVTLEEAAAIIGDRYNVKVTLANEALKKCRVMATFVNGESLAHVLTVISTINQTKYTVKKDGSVVFDGKGCD